MSILLYDNVKSKNLVYNVQKKKIVLTYFDPEVLNLGIQPMKHIYTHTHMFTKTVSIFTEVYSP